MYEFLQKYLSRKWSTVLTGLWYLMLILLILYMSLTPEGELRYLNY
ncbi:hypothetical protein [Flavilitoribacter nigricans]|nr:hypothetical protein [Flavilitoribacter nigricans]